MYVIGCMDEPGKTMTDRLGYGMNTDASTQSKSFDIDSRAEIKSLHTQ